MTTPSKQTSRRGIFLLPNLLTTSGLFAAFYSIVASMKGLYDVAAMAIFISMIADLLDGRVARATGSQSDFGAEYDSLSDMVSFGLAPALVVYSWSLHQLGKFGWLAAFVYTAATGLRLARFNTQHSPASLQYFQGLACPTAAGIVTSFMWMCHQYQLSGQRVVIITGVLTVVLAILMVSNLRYYSFKELDFKGKVPFVAIILVLLVFVGVALNPPVVLFVGFSIYGLSGIVISLLRLRHRAQLRRRNGSTSRRK